MEKEKNKTFVDKLWDSLASIKLAIIIFAVLALTSIVGTVIEQNADPERNIKLLAKLFGASAAPSLFRIFDSLGFMDMYHSWWFITILLLFSANLVICSIERLPKILKLVKEPVKPLPEERFKGFGIQRELTVKGNPEKAKGTVMRAVKSSLGFQLAETKEGHGYQLYSQKGNYTRLGVYVTHFSILVILVGAVVGIFFGFKGFLNLPEGRTYSVAFSRGHHMTDTAEFERIVDAVDASSGNLTNAAKTLSMDVATLKAKMRSFGIQPLDFGIRCDEFSVDFYENTDMPKAYKSRLAVIKNGKVVLNKVIEVNNPLTYDGVTFYQSSFGFSGGIENAVFRFRLASKDGRAEDLNLRYGGSFTIPGTDITGKIEDFSPALGIDEQTGRPFTYAQQMNNPAVYVNFFEKGSRKYGGWLLKRYPATWKLPDGNIVAFNGVWGMQYTGLQVRKDPGVWIVYFGCITMAVGLFVAFFMSHRKLWIRLVEEKNTTRVIIGASANKNRHAFERKIDKLLSALGSDKTGGK
ncbi:MAG: cytochrome c biogenesis protein ResB [Nitrospirae bacterium]|nr:cytochrome c biogenesis protein ResB [Nitrospirota bacterium]